MAIAYTMRCCGNEDMKLVSAPSFLFQHGEELMPYSTPFGFLRVQNFLVKIAPGRVIIIKGGLAGNI
jgi:hypothetical protein